MRPLVSIVIPCFNAGPFVAKAITSALEQNYQPIEVIVVDDGSTDDSADRIGAFSHSIQAVRQPNKGACAARNLGLEKAAGRYVMFLDADDYFEQGVVDSLVLTSEAKEAEIAFCSFAFEWPDGRRMIVDPAAIFPNEDPSTVMRCWIRGDYIGTCSVLWKTDFVRSIGGWRDGLRINQDGELMFRALSQKPRVAFADSGMSVYVQQQLPGRVSRGRNEAVYRDALAVLDGIESLVDEREFRRMQPDLARSYYGLARAIFSADVSPSLGRVALGRARRLGVRGHPGSRAHTVVAGLLGLFLKEKLAGYRNARRGES